MKVTAPSKDYSHGVRSLRLFWREAAALKWPRDRSRHSHLHLRA
jgi:hypothetical protein